MRIPGARTGDAASEDAHRTRTSTLLLHAALGRLVELEDPEHLDRLAQWMAVFDKRRESLPPRREPPEG